MKFENLSVPAPLSYAAPNQKARPQISPDAVISGPQPSGTRAIPGEERRRSQRVLLRVRAQIHVAMEGRATTFTVLTLNVNPHGALVVMDKSLAIGTRLVLENVTTRERVPCKVARQPRESSEGFQVPLEFDSPAPQFWRIAFPPADWRPEE